MQFDIVVLTDNALLDLDEQDWYSRQVHLEDGLVVAALQAQGLKVGRKDWADTTCDWSQCRAAVFRTTWDYFHRFDEFAPWLARVSHSTRLFNEAALIHWNLDKHYLADLQQAGINTVPTCYIEVGGKRSS